MYFSAQLLKKIHAYEHIQKVHISEYYKTTMCRRTFKIFAVVGDIES